MHKLRHHKKDFAQIVVAPAKVEPKSEEFEIVSVERPPKKGTLLQRLRKAHKELQSKIVQKDPLVKKLKASAVKSKALREKQDKVAQKKREQKAKYKENRAKKLQLKYQEALKWHKISLDQQQEMVKKALEEGRAALKKMEKEFDNEKLGAEGAQCQRAAQSAHFAGD